MIEAIKKARATKPPQPVYPALKEFSYGDDGQRYMVLFTSRDTGVVVHTNPDAGRKVGEFSQMWAEHFFTPFTGSITLSNV